MCHTIASQFVRDNFPRLTLVFLDYSFEESLCGISTTLLLKEYINDFSILIHSAPEIMLFTVNLDKNLINEKRITVSLMSST
jgi:hypothetical protein